MPELPEQTLHQALIVLGVAIANAVFTNLTWWVVGSKRRAIRGVGRGVAAFLAIANLALGLVCILRMLRTGIEWMYVALLVVAFVFAYRVGGATRGQYP